MKYTFSFLAHYSQTYSKDHLYIDHLCIKTTFCWSLGWSLYIYKFPYILYCLIWIGPEVCVVCTIVLPGPTKHYNGKYSEQKMRQDSIIPPLPVTHTSLLLCFVWNCITCIRLYLWLVPGRVKGLVLGGIERLHWVPESPGVECLVPLYSSEAFRHPGNLLSYNTSQ